MKTTIARAVFGAFIASVALTGAASAFTIDYNYDIPGYVAVRADVDNDGHLDSAELRDAKRIVEVIDSRN